MSGSIPSHLKTRVYKLNASTPYAKRVSTLNGKKVPGGWSKAGMNLTESRLFDGLRLR